MGYEMKVRVWVDSTTAKAIENRLGLGRVRHLEVKFLWAQQALKKKRFEIGKVRGEENVADIGTKPKSASEMAELLRSMGYTFKQLELIPRSIQCSVCLPSTIFFNARTIAPKTLMRMLVLAMSQRNLL